MKYTNGNWIAKDGQIYSEVSGKTLAVVPYFDTESEEQNANMKVMAESKNMLEILTQLDVAIFDGLPIEKGSQSHRDIIDAINNATE